LHATAGGYVAFFGWIEFAVGVAHAAAAAAGHAAVAGLASDVETVVWADSTVTLISFDCIALMHALFLAVTPRGAIAHAVVEIMTNTKLVARWR